MPPEARFELLRQRACERIPHAQDCGMQVLAISTGMAEMALPYRPDWLGDLERQVIHTGIIISLVDMACGLAVLSSMEQFEPVSTLDLRMDYLRPSHAGLALHCRAECYRLTRHIAFARATVWQDDPAAAVATSQATFMRSPRAKVSALQG